MSSKFLLTADEAAEALSLSRSTLYVELASGRLESIHVGRARRIPADALETWVKRKRQEAAGLDAA